MGLVMIRYFLPDGSDKTAAEFQVKKKIKSHRAQAMKKLQTMETWLEGGK